MKKKSIQWIVIIQQPFTIVEETAFHEFIKTFYPAAKFPTANTIKNNIMEYHKTETKKIQEKLQNNSSQISYTTDTWTSISMEAFLAITAYFIDSNWNIQPIILDFVSISGAHSSENLKNSFVTYLENFAIQTKVSFLIYIIFF